MHKIWAYYFGITLALLLIRLLQFVASNFTYEDKVCKLESSERTVVCLRSLCDLVDSIFSAEKSMLASYYYDWLKHFLAD